MQLIHYKQFYTPQFSSLASISVRRLDWAMGVNMPKAIDILVRLLPSLVDQKKSVSCAGINQNAITVLLTPSHRSKIKTHFPILRNRNKTR